MHRSELSSLRWPSRLALLQTAAFVAGCFPAPDVAKIKCTGPKSCPSKYTCNIPPGEPYGKCEATAPTDGSPGFEATSVDASRSDDAQVAVDATTDRSSAEALGVDGPATDAPADATISPDDRGSDLVAADLPKDLPLADSPTDLPAADLPTDLPAADLPISGPETGSGCSTALDCPGPCQTCSATRTCVPLTSQVDPTGRCAGTCDATGACKQTQGQACQSSDKCATGLSCSPDGYCCDRACTLPCESCETGVCKPVTGAPHAGHGNCTGIAAECAGTCTGAADGQCSWGTSACGQAGCTTLTNAQSQPTGTTLVPQGTCSAGACTAGIATSCPGSLVCASTTACKTSCATDADCLVGNACTGGVCGSKKGVGTACSANNQCQSGNCVDGFCCESACTGTCAACSRTKTGVADGYCRDVTLGTDPDNECAADASNPCGFDGTCGSGGSCRFRAASMACGTASCTGQGAYTPQGRCDGAGSCQAGTPSQCLYNMPCASSTACATSCTPNSTTGCPLGYKCAASGASCVLATMPCGGTACPIANGGGQCCISGPLGGPYAQTCLPPGVACAESGMQCHSKMDCPAGQVCCGSRGGCVVGSTRCVPPTDSLCQDGGMSSADQFCDVGITPSECTPGTTCLADGFGVCGPSDIYICR